METIIKLPNRIITSLEVEFIQRLIQDNPSWCRTRLSQAICHYWNWYTPKGQIKDMACRDLLRRLEKRELISLPESLSRKYSAHSIPKRKSVSIRTPKLWNEFSTLVLDCDISEITPIQIELAHAGWNKAVFSYLLAEYHYLGYKQHVGEHLKYLIYNRQGQVISCLLFGSAAWSCEDRDKYIAWKTEVRKQNLHLLTNNMRFLILPWIRVKNLASHILSTISKRIQEDWYNRYGHWIYLLETFVEKGRFQGTCYQAANWICVGQTKGRSRNDRYNQIVVPIKDIYLYPLVRNFKERLTHGF